MAKRLKEGQDTSKIIVISLENKKVVRIKYAKAEKELDKLLKYILVEN